MLERKGTKWKVDEMGNLHIFSSSLGLLRGSILWKRADEVRKIIFEGRAKSQVLCFDIQLHDGNQKI